MSSLYKYKGIPIDQLLSQTGVSIDTSVTNYNEKHVDILTKYKFSIASDFSYNSLPTQNYYIPQSSISQVITTYIDVSNSDLGYPGLDIHLPIYVEFTTPSTNPVNIPIWCTKLYYILIGGGGRSSLGLCGTGGGFLYGSFDVSSTKTFTYTVGTGAPISGDISGGYSTITYDGKTKSAAGGANANITLPDFISQNRTPVKNYNGNSLPNRMYSRVFLGNNQGPWSHQDLLLKTYGFSSISDDTSGCDGYVRVYYCIT